jgi:hypothetical protein
MRADLQRDIEAISAIPDRGSASEGERQAAEYIKRRFPDIVAQKQTPTNADAPGF